ncbi:MAG TPA: hypothetical protein VGP91_11890 [Actinoplanes sp.]|jgi:hypothetical protein|nr:hypothetical protein [Actinoplanes sp.]
MSTWTSERARYASLTRSRPADDPDLLAARRDLRAARAEDYIQKVVAGAPPLTPEQIQRLRDLLPVEDAAA